MAVVQVGLAHNEMLPAIELAHAVSTCASIAHTQKISVGCDKSDKGQISVFLNFIVLVIMNFIVPYKFPKKHAQVYSQVLLIN